MGAECRRILPRSPWIVVAAGIKAADVAEGNLKIRHDLGELELGKLDFEYFNDPDLESILEETELDTKKMTRLENKDLRLIYSVIYSEKFQLKGKRGQKVVITHHHFQYFEFR